MQRAAGPGEGGGRAASCVRGVRGAPYADAVPKVLRLRARSQLAAVAGATVGRGRRGATPGAWRRLPRKRSRGGAGGGGGARKRRKSGDGGLDIEIRFE